MKLQQYTVEQVAKHDKHTDAWIILHNQVYNITDFLEQHPGGISIMEDYFGQDITDAMQDSNLHIHSNSAYSMLEGYKIGCIQSDIVDIDNIPVGQLPSSWGKVDFHKAIVWQVGCLGKEYDKWVSSQPVHFKEPVRLFQSDIVERFSRTPCCNWSHYVNPETELLSSLFAILFTYLVGVFSWFFVEYFVHKYVYHWDSLAKAGYFVTNVMHFLLHGMHHKIPMDKDRLVAPHAIQFVIGFPLYCILYTVFQNHHICLTAIAGVATSYMYYDVTHYMLHHAPNPKSAPLFFGSILESSFFQKLKTHHMIHHFATSGHLHNMGISNRYVDILFGTLQEKHD